MPDLKESIDKLNFLLGKWEGFGAVQYPTIEGCEYREELIFETNNCEPLITYIQKTFYKKNNLPLHSESGYIFSKEDGSYEMNNVQNNGRFEWMKGTLENSGNKNILTFEYKNVYNDERIVRTQRIFEVKDNTLNYFGNMQTQKVDFQNHLTAKLVRV
ncbi:MAG TPA: FABP family protein [Ignavibacteria bacterium]|nr:FABP family protein [Ignavibacteria bacterium]